MSAPETSSPPVPNEFSDEQWQSSQCYLWDQAFQASEIKDSLQSEANELFSILTARPATPPGMTERAERANNESRFRDIDTQIQQLSEREFQLLSTLERLDAGVATVEEVLRFMPADEPEEQEKLSKKREAMLRQKAGYERSAAQSSCSAFLLGHLGYGFEDAQELRAVTDPRRIASGRNAAKLVSANGIDPYFAGEAFIYATADTHGGKVRRPSKNGNRYVSASGKRIRKR